MYMQQQEYASSNYLQIYWNNSIKSLFCPVTEKKYRGIFFILYIAQKL